MYKLGYYKWLNNKNKPYKHASLLADVQKALDERSENKGNYGGIANNSKDS